MWSGNETVFVRPGGGAGDMRGGAEAMPPTRSRMRSLAWAGALAALTALVLTALATSNLPANVTVDSGQRLKQPYTLQPPIY
jgi:hypothetical protein